MEPDVGQGPGSTGRDVQIDRGSGAGGPGASGGRRAATGAVGSVVSGSGPGGLGGLFAGVVRDLQELVRGEVRLAKTELKEEAAAAAGGAASVAAGGVVGLVGGVFLLNAVVELLGRLMPRWLASLLIGLGLLGAAGGLTRDGREKLGGTKLAPTRTAISLRETAAWAKARFSSAGGR